MKISIIDNEKYLVIENIDGERVSFDRAGETLSVCFKIGEVGKIKRKKLFTNECKYMLIPYELINNTPQVLTYEMPGTGEVMINHFPSGMDIFSDDVRNFLEGEIKNNHPEEFI